MRIVIIFLTSTIVIALHSKLITADKDERYIDNSHERIIRGYLNSYPKVRKPREPENKSNKCDNVTEVKSIVNPKVPLVKKPIPKFTDTDSSEEDYQMKIRNPIKYSDSVEHEDEDFNLDDYDFDVHHDEFAGRGKPLQPRVKVKLNTRQAEHESVKSERPKRRMSQNKIVPRKISKTTNKVASKFVNEAKKDDYDDEISISTKPPERERKAVVVSEDDISDESEDSKEYEARGSVRTVRSSISFSNYMNKLGEKTSNFMSKILSYLPIFPQIHLPKN